MAQIEPDPYGEPKRQSFSTVGRKTLNVERTDEGWLLSVDGRFLTTRDLPCGVDELLGSSKSRENLSLVLRILEWDVSGSG